MFQIFLIHKWLMFGEATEYFKIYTFLIVWELFINQLHSVAEAGGVVAG